MTRRVRRPQLQVYLPNELLDEAADAADRAARLRKRPATMSDMVEDALRDHLSILARRLNDGHSFDREKGAAIRAKRKRKRRPVVSPADDVRSPGDGA